MLAMRRAALAASFLVLSACAGPAGLSSSSQKAAIGDWGFELSAMDASTRPGDDFFQYASGSWLKTVQIPDDKTSYGSFIILRDKAEADVKETIDASMAETHAPGSVGQKVADFYRAYIDVAAIEAAGLEPARADLAAIAAAGSHQDIARLMAQPGMPGGPVGFYATTDSKDPSRYIMMIMQSGLGMPDRDYYLRADKQFQDIRAAYVAYIETMLTEAGYANPARAARDILRLETEIAKDSWDNARRRDLDLTYNPMTRAELESFAPAYPWDSTFAELGIPSFDRFVVAEKEAVGKLARLYRKTPVSAWRAYLTFHYLDSYAAVLPKAYDDASFRFAQVISGQKVQRERWKRGISALNGTLGEAVGELYVARHFSPEAKAQMLALVENIREAYRQRLEKLDWMGPETKKEALRKLASFRVKIAYPDKWRDYADLEVKPGEPLGNAKRASAFEWAYERARLDKPVDKDEWFMPPQIVNAYYYSVFNEIVFPAAILQPPFFDPGADPAVNYGGIGAVIGHEMGHGFDDQGAKSDADGILRDWWTKEDKARFAERTKALGEQFGAFEPLPGIRVNGQLTMGENIGDLGGISVAHEAYMLSLGGKEPETLDGFTGEQRFFLGYAQIWRSKYRDESVRNQVLSDPHSPARYRVNGIVPNVDAWYDAFGVGPDATMYIAPDKRVHIW